MRFVAEATPRLSDYAEGVMDRHHKMIDFPVRLNYCVVERTHYPCVDVRALAELLGIEP